MKIAILGHRGMLGSEAIRFFGEKHDIMTMEERITSKNYFQVARNIADKNPDVVINCLGQIKQKYENHEEMMYVNGEFPREMSRVLTQDQLLVQPSTDCVFSGKKGSYRVTDSPDPIDSYGLSKSKSEDLDRDRSLIIRTSVIGLEKDTNFSLLSWFLSRDSDVKGYTNHFWSGITTLEWCKSVELLIERNTRGLFHISSEKISKHELLVCMRDVFSKSLCVDPVIDETCIDRSLLDSAIELPSIRDQLEDLRYSTNV